jgi:hypothetical protein
VENNAVRRLLLALGALAIIAASFLATLQILNYSESQRTPAEMRNATRAAHARLLKDALEKYKAAHKAYPQTADFVDVDNLQKDLVGGGYLAEIPSDPLSAGGKKYRYISNGTIVAMLFDLEAGPNGTPSAGTCVNRVKADSANFKNYGPDCPF